MAPDNLTVGGLNADFQAQSKTFSLSCPSRNSAFRWGQVSLPCLSLLHDLSTHPDIAPTVQSKASCIHGEPHTRSGLGLSVLKYGCLNGLSASYITLQQEGQQASEAIPDTKPYPCSYCASGAKKKKKVIACPEWQGAGILCTLPEGHRARPFRWTSIPPSCLWTNA